MSKLKVAKRFVNLWKEVKKEANQEISLLVASDADELRKSFARLLGEGASQNVAVCSLEVPKEKPDFTVFLVVGGADELKKLADVSRKIGSPFVVGLVDGQALRGAFEAGLPLNTVFILEDLEKFLHHIAKKIPRSKLPAAGRSFPSLRKLVADRIIREVAWQNAFLASLGVLPGTDYPFLVANQVKMVLELASVYQRDLGKERWKELLVVFGGGALARSAARQLLTLIPGFGWLVKGGVAGSATLAMGEAVEEYLKRVEE